MLQNMPVSTLAVTTSTKLHRLPSCRPYIRNSNVLQLNNTLPFTRLFFIRPRYKIHLHRHSHNSNSNSRSDSHQTCGLRRRSAQGHSLRLPGIARKCA
jgi:hypothetical protein